LTNKQDTTCLWTNKQVLKHVETNVHATVKKSVIYYV